MGEDYHILVEHMDELVFCAVAPAVSSFVEWLKTLQEKSFIQCAGRLADQKVNGRKFGLLQGNLFLYFEDCLPSMQ